GVPALEDLAAGLERELRGRDLETGARWGWGISAGRRRHHPGRRVAGRPRAGAAGPVGAAAKKGNRRKHNQAEPSHWPPPKRARAIFGPSVSSGKHVRDCRILQQLCKNPCRKFDQKQQRAESLTRLAAGVASRYGGRG